MFVTVGSWKLGLEMMVFCQELQARLWEELPTPFEGDAGLEQIGHREDDKIEARNPLPLNDGFLDTLGLDDFGLKGLFSEWSPMEKDHLVAPVSNLKNNFQKITTL